MYMYKLEMLLTYQDMQSAYQDKQSTAKYRPSNIPVHLVTRKMYIYSYISNMPCPYKVQKYSFINLVPPIS